MKTTIIILAALVIGLGVGYLIFNESHSSSIAAANSGKQLYTCGMHPQIISDKPGYCPICGMKLVPKKDIETIHAGSIVIDPATVQNMGLTITAVTRQPLTRTIRAFGKIDYSDPLVRTINVKTPGWVEKLYVNHEGETVKAGQSLLSIYSPELVAAQREYIVALRNAENVKIAGNSMAPSTDLLEAATMRLKNWDISDDQIHNLNISGEPTKSLIINSPYTGVVVSKMVEQGDRLTGGMTAYKIADISRVWVKAFIYEQDVPFLKIGQEAEITTPSLSEQRFKAKIAYIAPYLNDHQQIEIRLDVDNPQGLLRPGMYAEVNLQSSFPGDRLMVPLKSVINTGAKKVVYLSMGDGSYSPRIIQTGAVGDNDLIEVISGLEPDEQVVTSGQFLLDSETRLNESLAYTHDHSGHNETGKSSAESTHIDMKMDSTMANDSTHSMTNPVDTTSNADTTKMQNMHESQHQMKTKSEEAQKLSGIYTCPMPIHFHVLQYGPGKCPECGMDLVPVEQTNNTEVYYCPMAEDSVVTDKPGSCPKCGMKLVKLQRGAVDD
jgi:RND family efflux transporter MFP subunit